MVESAPELDCIFLILNHLLEQFLLLILKKIRP